MRMTQLQYDSIIVEVRHHALRKSCMLIVFIKFVVTLWGMETNGPCNFYEIRNIVNDPNRIVQVSKKSVFRKLLRPHR